MLLSTLGRRLISRNSAVHTFRGIAIQCIRSSQGMVIGPGSHHQQCHRNVSSGSRDDGGRKGAREEEKQAAAADEDSELEKERKIIAAKDPFGFRELKENYVDGSLPYPKYTEEQLEAVEETLEKRGKIRVGKNIFGLEEIPKEMADAWTEGLPPPQLHRRTPEVEGLLEAPEDLYWPSHIDTNIGEDEQLYPDNDEPVYSAEEEKELANLDLFGGACNGKLQRKNNRPLLCKKVDLEEVEFSNVALLSKFLSPAGLIKPRRASGLCSKCQRRVARTIKQARNLGMIPNTSGVELYQRIKPPQAEGPMLITPSSTRQGGAATVRSLSKNEKVDLLRRKPSATI